MLDKKQEAALFFAKRTVEALRMAQDALNGYARQTGSLSPEECPIVQVWEDAHANISSFLEGGELIRWRCPFCGEVFSE